MLFTIRRIAFAAGLAGLALAAGAARAGGDVQIDSPIGGQTTPFTLCHLGQPCSGGFNMEFTVPLNNGSTFDHIFVYDDGVVGLGHALPLGATLGNLASLGIDYAAVGFEDLSPTSLGLAALGVTVTDVTISMDGGTDHNLPAGTVDEILVDYFLGDWRDHDSSHYHGMMQVRFATHKYGTNGNVPLISLLHATPDGAQFNGVSWPDTGVFTDGIVALNLGPAAPPPGAPEPSAWMLAIVGFGLAGGALRGQRRSAAT